MVTRDWIELIGVIIGGTGGLYATSLVLIKIGRVTSEIDKIKELERKVDALQSQVDKFLGMFFLKSEAGLVLEGWATKHSRYTSSAEAKALLDPLYERIKLFVETLPTDITHNNLALEIGYKFGEEIITLLPISQEKQYDYYVLIAADIFGKQKEVSSDSM
jgi:hypothetical protein